MKRVDLSTHDLETLRGLAESLARSAWRDAPRLTHPDMRAIAVEVLLRLSEPAQNDAAREDVYQAWRYLRIGAARSRRDAARLAVKFVQPHWKDENKIEERIAYIVRQLSRPEVLEKLSRVAEEREIGCIVPEHLIER